MARVLVEPHRELLELTGFADYLAVDTVLHRQRAAGRIIVPRSNAERVQSLILRSGAACRRARFELLKIPSVVRGTDHVARPVVGNPDADAVLYFGITDLIAEGAELASITRNHRLVGRLFAYPECCTAFYENALARGGDCTPFSIPNSGPFPAEMNPVTAHLFRPLAFLFHFPCSPECQASLQLRRSRQRHIERLFPDIAEVNGLEAGIALYGERLGVGLITSYSELGPGYYRVHNTVSSDPFIRRLFSDPASSLLRLTDAHDFQIGNTVFTGPGDFAAVFR